MLYKGSLGNTNHHPISANLFESAVSYNYVMAGIPCVALAYERKSYELACQVGIEDLCHELRELKWEDLWKSFIKAEGKASDFRIKIRKAHQSL